MTKQSLIIRTDANTKIGVGHFMRCLALAQQWKINHGEVYFVMAEPSEAVQKRIHQENMQLCCINELSGTIKDGDETAKHIHNLNSNWLVLDGYHFQQSYQTSIQQHNIKILYIDDFCHADSYVAEIVLNQNLYATQEKYLNRSDSSTLLLGAEYVLLRQEFLMRNKQTNNISKEARRILISFGGGDEHNITTRVLNELIAIPNLDIKAVIGPCNPFESQLNTLNEQHNYPFQLLRHVNDMPSLMSWSDVAIVSGGISNYELMYLGIPFLVIITAKNHEELVEYLGTNKMAINCGWYNRMPYGSITNTVQNILLDHTKRLHFSNSGKQIIDGKGASRVIQSITSTY